MNATRLRDSHSPAPGTYCGRSAPGSLPW
jgi:hypothetical protein